MLNTGTLSVLGNYRGVPEVRIWNGSLVGDEAVAGTVVRP